MPSAAIATRRKAGAGDRGVAATILAGALALPAGVLAFVLRHPRNSLLALIAIGSAAAVLVNALYLQAGPHPAPMMAVRPLPVADGKPTSAVAPRAGQDSLALKQPQSALIANIQRELARRGFYDGAIDGVNGAKTDAAIRDFEQFARRRTAAEPSSDLLQAIQSTPVRTAAAPAKSAPPRSDPIAELIGSSRQVIAVQRALTDFGYGPVKPSGVIDKDTRAAVMRFERERRLPIKGEVSPRVVRELAARTGRPLE